MMSFASVFHNLWKAVVIAVLLCLVLSESDGLSEYRSKCLTAIHSC